MARRPIPVTEAIAIAPDEIALSYVRAGGPGGQNVNKVATKAVLRFNLRTSASLPDAARARALRRLAGRLTRDGDLVLASSVHRTQARNREAVLAQLGAVLAAAVRRPRRRKPTRPSAAAVERRLTAKHLRSKRKRERRTSE